MNALRKAWSRVCNWGSAAWRFCLNRGRIFCGGPYEVSGGTWACPQTGTYTVPKAGRYVIHATLHHSDGTIDELKRDATPDECIVFDNQRHVAGNPNDSECASDYVERLEEENVLLTLRCKELARLNEMLSKEKR